MRKYEIILFDLDGTLTDPKIGITSAVQYALSKFDIEVKSLDELEKFIGPPLFEAFIGYYSFDEEKSNKGIQYYREYFSEKGIFENKVYLDIPWLLQTLKKKGFLLAIATSKPTIFAERILEHFNLNGYFHVVGGSNFDGTRTAKAEVIEYVISKLGVEDLKNVIMIGDRKHDIIGADKNGIDSIAVGYGYGSYEEFQEVKPTYYAENVKDILEILVE